jgi:uncharacterized protein DUF2442
MAKCDEFELADQRAKRKRDRIPTAVSAHYDRGKGRIVIGLNTQMDLVFPPNAVRGLENAKPGQLESIEITPSGYGLHFPRLDADLYLPALLEGFFGSKRWMAARLGALGGSSKSTAKAAASRKNGQLGGRPPRAATRHKPPAGSRQISSRS